jgi:oligopeptide transport system ATP-binding protein
MSAVPIPDPMSERSKTIEMLEGDLPSPIHQPSGCVNTKLQLNGGESNAVACLLVG